MPITTFEKMLSPINKIYGGHSSINDISYGDDPDMAYDEYPVNGTDAPVVIFWHGGSWKTGNKSMYRFVGHQYQAMGAHTFVINYPKYPKRVYPGFLEDAKQAVYQIKKSHPGQKIIVMGHSSGANTAMNMAMDPDLKIDKVVSYAGVTTLSPRYWRPVFGDAVDNKSYDPRKKVKESPASTEFLLIHGLIDPTVPVSDSISLNSRLTRENRKSKLIVLTLMEHILILPTIIIGPRFITKRKVKQFILN